MSRLPIMRKHQRLQLTKLTYESEAPATCRGFVVSRRCASGAWWCQQQALDDSDTACVVSEAQHAVSSTRI